MSNRKVSCCFTGHRTIASADLPGMDLVIESILRPLVLNGTTRFYCGGARGFDMLAGFVVLRMKQEFPKIKLILALPCRDQDVRWSKADRELHRLLLDAADLVIYLAGAYDPDCMRRRNLYMVEHSSTCVCYLRNLRSGAGQTVRMAEARGVPMINLAQATLPPAPHR